MWWNFFPFPHFTGHVITYPNWDYSLLKLIHVSKIGPRRPFWFQWENICVASIPHAIICPTKHSNDNVIMTGNIFISSNRWQLHDVIHQGSQWGWQATCSRKSFKSSYNGPHTDALVIEKKRAQSFNFWYFHKSAIKKWVIRIFYRPT